MSAFPPQWKDNAPGTNRSLGAFERAEYTPPRLAEQCCMQNQDGFWWMRLAEPNARSRPTARRDEKMRPGSYFWTGGTGVAADGGESTGTAGVEGVAGDAAGKPGCGFTTRTPLMKYSVSPKHESGIPGCCSKLSATCRPSAP